VTAPVCEWPVSYAACGADCWPPSVTDDADKAMFESMAAQLLWNWTGQRFGSCPVVVRPCRTECAGDGIETFWGRGPYPYLSGGGSWVPMLVAGKWFNVSCGGCGLISGCTCGPDKSYSIELPGPIASINEVNVDGQTVDPVAYRVDNSRWLIRTDGGTWPWCQDFSLPTGEAGTWDVDYMRGLAVPEGGQLAAGRLACELAKANCGDSSCQLPKRLQSITRQGVTVAMIDSMEDVDKGRTGIWLIDSWVSSVNMPVHQGGSVYSVDTMGRKAYRRQTWPTQ
jgi:hypothetical protein